MVDDGIQPEWVVRLIETSYSRMSAYSISITYRLSVVVAIPLTIVVVMVEDLVLVIVIILAILSTPQESSLLPLQPRRPSNVHLREILYGCCLFHESLHLPLHRQSPLQILFRSSQTASRYCGRGR